ncbi:hypothetical protein ElyMa_005687900 [Elysia marginata]|uniref:Integrase zinc-binding domain-containing protein n=1 Tax=Elysia marginata TaxID=1093978 RepID=A0AAV4FEN0_9GAST|nr:hypothetical protein ElyMa_005687900 [Elysia marginata]
MGEQAPIPQEQLLREVIKQRLHAAHLGYNSMMHRAHTAVRWPGIQNEVKQLEEQCDLCKALKPRNQKKTLIFHDKGNLPWEKIGGDLF